MVQLRPRRTVLLHSIEFRLCYVQGCLAQAMFRDSERECVCTELQIQLKGARLGVYMVVVVTGAKIQEKE